MRTLAVVLAIAAVVSAAAAVRAQGIDAAVVGDTAELKDAGELDVTLGVDFEEEGAKRTTELYVEIEYGVTERFEVGLKVPYLFVDPNESGERRVDGIGDVEVSVAVGLIDEPILLSTSLTVTLPTGNDRRSDDLGEGSPIIEPAIATEFPLGDLIAILEIGGEIGRESKAFNYSATLAYEIEETVLSLGVEGSLDDEHTTELSLVPGIGFELIEDVDLAIEGRIGLTKDTADWGIVFEITYGF